MTMTTRLLVLPALAFCLNSISQAQSEPTQNPAGVTGYEYKLPSLAEGTRLLFIGDSITDMKWGRNEKDRNHYLGHSFVYLIASRLHTDLFRSRLEFFNRGISGNTVGDLKKRWQKDAIDMKPDVLTILIGVNDVGRACRAGKKVDLVQWEADYRFILEASRKGNPELKIILLDPFVLPSGRFTDQGQWKMWNGQCSNLRPIVDKLAGEFKAIHIETQRIFDDACKDAGPEHWIWDGVHPLPQGHELIARNWIETVAEHLKAQ